ncbi:MAG TPA: NAD(P)H-binding protein [Candidatus Dormibacteraeota bacterium]|nr:NAD(P)H-binding protein [Candidatus Dormibacteraeota bacterium]
MILVTGASGFVGSHVVRRLVETGVGPIRAMVRDRSRTPARDRVEVVEADLTRPETLGDAVAGASVIIHAAAITANVKEPYRGAYDRINRVGTENLVKAASASGVSRLVVMSGLGTRPAAEGTYMATRWGLEEAVRNSGIPYVILQPSILFGDGAEFVAALSRLARASPVLPLLGGGKLRFQPLWIEDLVTCLVASTKGDQLLQSAIPLGGSEYATFKEILQTICTAMSVRRLMVPLPLSIARLQAGFMAAILPNPPLTPAAMELFGFDNATDPDVVDRRFGFHPRGFREHVVAHGLEESRVVR